MVTEVQERNFFSKWENVVGIINNGVNGGFQHNIKMETEHLPLISSVGADIDGS